MSSRDSPANSLADRAEARRENEVCNGNWTKGTKQKADTIAEEVESNPEQTHRRQFWHTPEGRRTALVAAPSGLNAGESLLLNLPFGSAALGCAVLVPQFPSNDTGPNVTEIGLRIGKRCKRLI
jgi:hypothetical protein